jgi:hypothetical protein
MVLMGELPLSDVFTNAEYLYLQTTPVTILLLLVSLLNTLYLFTTIRAYHLHLRDSNLVDSPRARMVRMDMAGATRDMDTGPAPSLIWRVTRGLDVHMASGW